DRAVRRVLGTLAAGQARRVVFFRQLRVHGRLVEIAAVDRLSEILELQRGRLPRACTSAACEVVAIGGSPARLAEGDVRLDLVGSAQLRDRNLFGYISAAGSSPAAPPLLLLAPSVEALLRYPALSPYYRVYSWLSPLQAERLHTWQIPRTLAAESRAQNSLYAADSAFRLSSPDEELLTADHRGRVAARWRSSARSPGSAAAQRSSPRSPRQRDSPRARSSPTRCSRRGRSRRCSPGPSPSRSFWPRRRSRATKRRVGGACSSSTSPRSAPPSPSPSA